MGETKKPTDLLGMDAKLMARADSYEMPQSKVKQRPPAPAPMVRAQTAPTSSPVQSPKK